MAILAFLIIIFACQLSSAGIPNPELEKLHYKCKLEDDEFWDAYTWNFKNSSEVHIIKIVTNYSRNVIEEFITEMMLSYPRFKREKKLSFIMQRYWLTYIDRPFLLKNNTEIVCEEEKEENYTNLLWLHHKNTSTQENVVHERIRSFSADLNYAFHLVVWDIEDFNQFLIKKFRRIFPNPRGVYMVAFISPRNIKVKLLHKLFKKIWDDFGVLNIVFQLPCSCGRKNLFMFNPFERVNNTWGIIKKFTMTDVEVNSKNFRNSLKTLNGYPLKVALFHRIPTVVKPPKCLQGIGIYKNLSLSNGYCGLDAILMLSLAEKIQFKPVVVNSEKDYGYGDVVFRRVDISFNSRFVDGFSGDLVEYLTPVINDKFCLVMPKARRIPQWLSIFRCFDLSSWFLIFFSYVACSVYWYTVPTNRINSFLDIFALFISVPVNFVLLNNLNNHRVFLFACMIFNIIIVGSFQGQLVTSFSTLTYYPDINTLNDFAKSGMFIVSKNVGNIFGDDGSELMKDLNNKIVITNRSSLIREIAQGKMFGTFERMADAKLRMILYEGENTVHICQECPKSYYFTYIVPTGSPYIHVFNIVITMFRESGLVMKWSNDIIDALIITKRVQEKFDDDDSEINKQFSLSNLQIPFYILMCGWFTSSVIFVTEIFIKNKRF